MDHEDPLSRLQSTLRIHGRSIFIVCLMNSAITVSSSYDHPLLNMSICIALPLISKMILIKKHQTTDVLYTLKEYHISHASLQRFVIACLASESIAENDIDR